jgi:hypothetical protein
MIPFDPQNPFPLLPDSSSYPTYKDAQKHSAEADAWLGLNTEDAEKKIQSISSGTDIRDEQLWVGLPVKTLLTPYTEIRTLLSQLDPKPDQRIVDLGAGYGRMGFVIGRHFPDVHFIGYEIVEERVEESNRCLKKFNYLKVQMRVADLSAPNFKPVEADVYFLYDFGSRVAIEKTLFDLRGIARNRPIQVVGRGRASRDAIEREHPWLSQVHAPRHFDHYSIYQSGT